MQRIYRYFTETEEQQLLREAKEGQSDTLIKFLQSNPSPEKLNAISDKEGNTLLMIACKNNKLESVMFLLRAGADPNQYNYKGTTALAVSAKKGFLAIVSLLLRHHAEVNQGNLTEDTTPLYLAAQEGHKGVLQILLNNHADPNRSCSDGDVPLSAAIQHNHGQIVSVLLEHGADIKKVKRTARSSDTSILKDICDSGNFDVLSVLLKQQGISLPLTIEDDITNITQELCCPIMRMPMQDPVTVSTGQTYERDALISMFRTQNNPETVNCPVTAGVICRRELLNGTNIAIKKTIEGLIEKAQATQKAEADKSASLAKASLFAVKSESASEPVRLARSRSCPRF